MTMADLCAHFGVAPSTAGNKAKLVRKALTMRQLDHTWMLPSEIASSSLPWMIAVNGLIRDARSLPLDVQEIAVRKGLIPYVVETADQDR